MKGTTRCPHCNTRFRIAEAQLTAHQGRVRCGQCHQAFDALPSFIQEQAEPAAASIETPGIAAQAAPSIPAAEITKPVEPVDQHIEAPVEICAAPMPAEAPAEATGVEFSTTDDTPAAISSVEADIAHAAGHLHLPDESVDTESQPPTHDAIVLDETIDKPVAGASAFLAAEEAAFGATPAKGRRWPWISGIALSVILLLAQSAYFFRVGLAVKLPALKPVLVEYCRLLNCTVPLPRDSALISIESSGLDADTEHANLITLNALLRNRAGHTQGFPMLSLTLNDSHDKPLARRLFLPAEYLPNDESEPSGFAANHEISVKLHLDTTDLKAAGYRLELFYSPG